MRDKQLKFTGARHFHHNLFGGWQLTDPQPVTSVPLRWEYAFGGSGVVVNPEHAVDANTPPYLLNEVCYSNPLGRGWIEKRQEDLGYKLDKPLRELPAPQIEPIDRPVWRLDRFKHPEGELDAHGMAQVAAGYTPPQLRLKPKKKASLASRSWMASSSVWMWLA